MNVYVYVGVGIIVTVLVVLACREIFKTVNTMREESD